MRVPAFVQRFRRRQGGFLLINPFQAFGGGGGGKTFTFVQSPTSVSSSSAAPAVSFGASTPAGNLVYVVITQTYGANPPRTITNVRDNVDTGVDYVLLHETNNGGTLYVHVYGKVATAAGTRTVTAAMGGVADCTIEVVEWNSSGGFTFGNVSGTDKSAATGTGTSVQAGSITPATNALYIHAAVWTNGTGTAMTATGGWAEREQRISGSPSLIEVQDRATTGAQNPAMTLGSSQAWASVIVAYT